MQNGPELWKQGWQGFNQVHHILSTQIQPSHLRYLSQRNGNSCSHKNLHVNLRVALFINTKKLVTTQVPVTWMNKQTMEYAYTGILIGFEKEHITDNARHCGWIPRTRQIKEAGFCRTGMFYFLFLDLTAGLTRGFIWKQASGWTLLMCEPLYTC